ncbi:hypothetical protein M409DRAFT_17769 [Zasmidium cellare ATCC 36951]|uniref:Cytochrome P450 n=1 Tax=Zasmidium cellare ATCC 36951 TaxID=1080233 RepID=A0A6A6D293_ZASCE|nr:uncharacterized protein M409DRAFT_17769 [Zasmidium cellare ATCC 36951]KAF2172538.1 hypothetical protein M409DRAFT_17769 [Zasmidium cellare ATCC 36951]
MAQSSPHLPSSLPVWPLLPYIAVASAIALTGYLLSIRYRPGLRQVPGPLLASFSDLDRIISTAKGLCMNYHLKLHEQYGPLVRIGPKHVSISDPSYIPVLYGINSKFWKTDFYMPFDVKTPAGMRPTIFSVRDEHRHRDIRRPIANAYALSTLKELEPMNDACSEVLTRKFDKYVGQDIDLGKWVHWYAFDVITSITFSNTLGMMEQEKDIDRIIESIEGRLMYNSVVGQAPYLHRWLFGNEIGFRLGQLIPAVRVMNSSRYIVSFAAKQLERYNKQEFNTIPLKDMLDRFKRFKDEEQLIDDPAMLSHAVSNIFAGSDTTAASLRAIFYYLTLNKPAHTKLLSEIDTADAQGQLSDPVTFAEAQNLPYFQAVIKEALRMHPAVGLLLERLVPEGGAEIGGVHLPEGTVVGINPWVAARDTATYGADAYEFRPERWLEADEGRLKVMERNFLAFGGGARTCIGKNISMLEMSKLVPQLYRRFDFELSYPGREWTLHDYWFVKQTGLICRVKRRERA